MELVAVLSPVLVMVVAMGLEELERRLFGSELAAAPRAER